MLRGAYGINEVWSGLFGQRPVLPGWSPFGIPNGPPAQLRIVERAGEGRDTLDIGEGWLDSGRLDGQIRSGARVDLSGTQRLVRAGRVSALAATRPPRRLESVRGSDFDDTIVGNAAANLLEGRYGRDAIRGGTGLDTCLTHAREDDLRGCERIRRRHTDR